MRQSNDRAEQASTIQLPPPPDPVGSYSAVVIRGDLGFVSGQFPLSGGTMLRAERMSGQLAPESLMRAARLAALNVAAQIRRALPSWDGFGGLCRVDGIIAAPHGFISHAKVLDAASDTFVEIFGPVQGAHARSAVSSPSLPGDAAVELVVTFAVKRGGADQFRAVEA
jgi:enamine deaminase RidA (YjgF/YER057c/UK114 family)